MTRFASTFKKELLLLSRDLHALLVLFVMPMIFIIIMSLAMQDTFSEQESSPIDGKIVNLAETSVSNEFIQNLQSKHYIAWKTTPQNEMNTAKRLLNADEINVLIIINQHFDQQFDEDESATINNGAPSAYMLLAPSVSQQTKLLIEAAAREALAKTHLSVYLSSINDSFEGDEADQQFEDIVSDDAILVSYSNNVSNIATGSTTTVAPTEMKVSPTSVQQSVPAWLVFGMFFVLIPISASMIVEKQQHTLQRLQSMGLSSSLFLVGKVIPYYFINQLQLIGMLLVGVFIVPLLGGDKLVIGDSWVGLFILSSAISCAALGVALLIAVSVNTTEQAISVGGIFNILLAAIGGIMVPKFVMPPFMQELTIISPLAWGLEGFLDLFLRSGDLNAIAFEVCGLVVFGVTAFVVAVIIFRRHASQGWIQ